MKLRKLSPCIQTTDDQNEHTLRGTQLHEAMESLSSANLSEDDEWAFQDALQQLQDHDLMNCKCEFLFPSFCEQQLELYANENVLTYGTADLILQADDALYLVDYKFGKMRVDEPTENLQLRAYAAAALQKYKNYEVCKYIIIQPKQTYKWGHLDKAQIGTVVDEVKNIINECNIYEASGKIRPHVDSCVFCKHFGTCSGPVDLIENVI